MKNYVKLMATATLAIGLLVSLPLSATQVKAETIVFGSTGAIADDALTLEDMLNYAIQDEYMAQAEYVAIIDAFSAQRPYTNIVRAEATHIQELLPLFAAYGYEVPDDDAASRVILPETLLESYSNEVTTELNNIAMYDKFLSQELPDDVRLVFEELKAASEQHLVAFQRAVDRDGSGYGRGYSNAGSSDSTGNTGYGRMGGTMGRGNGSGGRGAAMQNNNGTENQGTGICILN